MSEAAAFYFQNLCLKSYKERVKKDIKQSGSSSELEVYDLFIRFACYLSWLFSHRSLNLLCIMCHRLTEEVYEHRELLNTRRLNEVLSNP